ncbi:SMI1/KNR4 family protein [Actinomadura sp. 3N508]|uniref:SMI1/KNR4 family protein n=1 Tax=Actinomadura sp. 3N508 TaxID=3375153 RepID=UPI0037A0896B
MSQGGFSVAEFRDRLVAQGLAAADDFLGCSDEEIAAVVRAQRVIGLPALYRDFLAVMGKRPYPLMQGTDWAYRDLLELRQDAADLLDENGLDQAMLDDALVIAMHQGYVLYYIPHASTAPPDPPVWTYVEGEEPSQSFATFREFLVSLEEMRRREVATWRDLEASGRFSMTRIEDDG